MSVIATVNVRDTLRFRDIQFDQSKQGDRISFAITLTGTARLERSWANGESREIESNGCPRGSVWAPDGLEVHCSQRELYNGSVPWVPGTGTIGDVVAMGFEADRDGARTSVDFVQTGSFVTEAGDSTYFQFPKLGSLYSPAHMRKDYIHDLGEGHDYFVPDPLGLIIEYANLRLGSRLDSASDEPVSTQPLAWVRSDTGDLAPGGVIVDGLKSPTVARNVFWLALLGGAVVGSTTIVFAAWRRAVASWRDARRSRRQ